MSLLCSETLRKLKYGEPLHVVTRQDTDSFSAVAEEVLANIKPAERRDTPCPTDEKGFDVHSAAAGLNPISRTYSWLEGFKKKEFLFSISEETAKRVMPTHWTRTYDPENMPPEPDIRVDIQPNPPFLADYIRDKSRMN